MKRPTPILIAASLLGLVTLACYWPVMTNGFIGLDDPKYMVLNEHLNRGISWAGIGWAFTSFYASNWHPLTWISHMMDCQVFGLNPAGHHFTSLMLHAVNSTLVLQLFSKMTGAFWRSLFVAALFAFHPLHVESVAWAAERKDVLSTFFFLLTLAAYFRYAQRKKWDEELRKTAMSGISSETAEGHSRGGYYFALIFFALGLMSKPMLVTLPCVLLLLDLWPLRRFELAENAFPTRMLHMPGITPLVLEKVPFFVLSLAASLITYAAQNAGGAVASLTSISLRARLENAAVAYVRYLWKTVWPTNLSVFYPLPDSWPVVTVMLAVAVLVLLSAGAVLFRRRCPYLLVGWLWFLGTLVPTIGIVQVGSQSMADRYMYIPSIGLFLIVAWGTRDLFTRGRGTSSEGEGAPSSSTLVLSFRNGTSNLIPVASTACLLACLATTSVQVNYWHNERSLFGHAIQVTSDNYLAYDHLAKVCENEGKQEEALAFYNELIRLKPQYPEGRYNLGTLLLGMGRSQAAAPHLLEAVKLRPNWSQARLNLGLALFRENKPAEAVEQFEAAVRLDPRNADAYLDLGIACLTMNRPGDAAKHFEQALKLKKSPETQFLLALALSRANQPGQAALQAEKARSLARAAGQTDIVDKANHLLELCRTETGI